MLICKARTKIEAQNENKSITEQEPAQEAEQKSPVGLSASEIPTPDDQTNGGQVDRGSTKRKRSASIPSESMGSNDLKSAVNSTSTENSANTDRSELAQDLSEDEIQFETFIGFCSKPDEREEEGFQSANPSANLHERTESADSDRLTFVTAATSPEEPTTESGRVTHASKRARLSSPTQLLQTNDASSGGEGSSSDTIIPIDELAHLMDFVHGVEASNSDGYSDGSGTPIVEAADAYSDIGDYDDSVTSTPTGPSTRSQVINDPDVVDVDEILGPVDEMKCVLV